MPKIRTTYVLDIYSLSTTSLHVARHVRTIVNRYYDVQKCKTKDPKAFRAVEMPGCMSGCLYHSSYAIQTVIPSLNMYPGTSTAWNAFGSFVLHFYTSQYLFTIVFTCLAMWSEVVGSEYMSKTQIVRIFDISRHILNIIDPSKYVPYLTLTIESVSDYFPDVPMCICYGGVCAPPTSSHSRCVFHMFLM